MSNAHTVRVEGLILGLERLLVVLLEFDSGLEGLRIERRLDHVFLVLVPLEIPISRAHKTKKHYWADSMKEKRLRKRKWA